MMDYDKERMMKDPEYRRKVMAKKLRDMAGKMESGEVEIEIEKRSDDKAPTPCGCEDKGSCGGKSGCGPSCGCGPCKAKYAEPEEYNLFDQISKVMEEYKASKGKVEEEEEKPEEEIEEMD